MAKGEEDDTKRDKGKGIKFAKMKDQLPAHILHMYDNEAKNHASPRQYRTMIINKLVQKDADGSFSLNVKDAVFEEGRQLYEKKFGKDTNKALPKSLMMGLYFQGNKTEFQKAVDIGEIEEIEEGGKVFYSFKELKTGTERAAIKIQSVSSGSVKIGKQEFNDMRSLVDSLGWSFKLSTKDHKQLAIENTGLPKPVVDSFGQAKGACEKLEKQGMQLMKKLAVDSSHKVHVLLL